MAGAVLRIDALAGLGRQSVAAPAPLGFSHIRGVEPFALRPVLDLETADGERLEVSLDRAHFERLQGPLNRRYIYIRGIFYGAGLGGEDERRALHFGLCGNGPLARDLGIGKLLRYARVRAAALTAGERRSFTIEVECNP